MAGSGDEVASAIDAHVREGIEKMVAEIRSSIEDVRAVVDSQLRAAMQSVQADVNAISFLPHIKKSLDELEAPPAVADVFAAPPAVAAPSTPSAADATQLKQALQGVESGKSQVDVLNALLEQALAYGSRAALLILRGETFSGWKGVGFSTHGGNDEAVKRFNAAPGLIAELDQVLRDERVVVWDGANLSTRLGGSASEKAILVPMVIKDKVSAAVYVDAFGDDVAKLDKSSVEILVFATGLLIDTLAIRKKIPSPSLTEGAQTSDTVFAAPPPPAPAPAPPPRPVAATPPPAAPRPAPAAPPPQPRPAPAPAPVGATVAIPAAQIREALYAQQQAAPVAAPPPAPTRPMRPSVEIPKPAGIGEERERPSTQYVPPAGLARGGAAAAAAPPEDAKKQDEARRFARLLVSEIKLYNESKVEQGRKNKDLYQRLKEDIDRSRQMYDARISEDIRKGSNFFYDELVRILADGDASALGM